MKRFFTIISVLCALVAFASCNKDGAVLSYYMYDIDSSIKTGSNSTTNISAISDVLKNKQDRFDNMSESQAKAEWKSFVAAIDDSKVVIGTDVEYYAVALVKVNVYEKEEFQTESNVVATVGKKTWRKSGAVEE